ncbi:MAG TPA: PAS domain S-box protein [Thermoanaerobaculia bacterium]|jgi:PAS domain S-box-containing protein
MTEGDQQQNEASLRRYRELFELTPNGYLMTDAEGRVAEANRAAEKLFGRTRRELAGTPLAEFVPAEHQERFRARLDALRSGRAGRIQDWQLPLSPSGAAAFDAEVTVAPVADGGRGEVSGLVWLVRDVTERKRAEEHVRDSERSLKRARGQLEQSLARTQGILDSAVDGILTIDERGIVQSINPSAVAMFGYAAEEVVGRNVRVLMPPPYHEEHDDYLRRYLETGDRKVIGIGREVVGRRKDGTTFPLDLAVAEFFLGHRRAFVGTLRDVTQRHEIEEALRREREYAESLVETAPAIVLVLDVGGRIVRFNRYMEELSGYRLDEVRGRDWFTTFLPNADRELVREVFAEVLRGDATHATNTIATREGHEREIEWRNTLLRDAAGETSGILAIGLDITERRRLEEQFRQAQKMEAIGRLAGGVAHDFNTLLGSITGFSEMLLDGLEGGDPLQRAAEQIFRGAQRGAALTRQLLAFGRRQVLQPRVLALGSVVADMDDMLRRLIGEDVELVHRDGEPCGAVRVDSGQLEQAIMNLAVNSRDAMPRGGRIVIETRDVELSAADAADSDLAAPGRYVMLAVSDDGCGMDETTRRRLFEPFFTTKELGKGTGLGLSMVYGFVKQSGGGITVESQADAGTTFRIYLPRAEGEAVAAVHAPPAAASAATAGSETVLLVEDDEMFRGLLCEVLAAKGYQVLSAPEPAAALGLLGEHRGSLDLVVSDLVMPGMTGTELVDHVRAEHPETKVILMSGYTDEDLAERGATGDGEPFLQKPFSTKVFLQVVRDVLGPVY